MKILYAIQGTGNGHISRACEIVPILKKYAEVDVLVSGKHAELNLPFKVDYKLKGLGFFFGKKGGVDVWKSIFRNYIPRALNEARKLPVQKYDLVLNDFEPISAWSCLFKNKLCISLSHQSAVIAEHSPVPEKVDRFGIFVLRNYAPCKQWFGFHFYPFEERIFTPVIRQEIRKAIPVNKKHYTIYLPSYSDSRIIEILQQIPSTNWQVFSKHSKRAYQVGNIAIEPINNERFVKSLIACEGVLTGSGFETPAEALFLKKKLMVIPMSNQYEQKCNASALRYLGVPVISALNEKHIESIKKFVELGKRVEIEYPDVTEEIIQKIITLYQNQQLEGQYDFTAKYFDWMYRKLSLSGMKAAFKGLASRLFPA